MLNTILVGLAAWVAAVIVFAVALPAERSEVGAVVAFVVAVGVALLWHRGRSQQSRTVNTDERHEP